MSRTTSVILVVMCVLLLGPSSCESSNILVVPVDGSHWINMKIVLEELHARGHEITVLHADKRWYTSSNSSFFTSIHIPMVGTKKNSKTFIKLIKLFMECRRYSTLMRSFSQKRLITYILAGAHGKLAKYAENILDDPVFMKKLQDFKFDLMLTDPALTLGVLLGSYLKLPMVFNVHWINTVEAHFTIAPSPVSYIPVPGSELQNQMDFLERTKNMLHYLYYVYEQHFIINPVYSDLFQKHFSVGTDLLSLEKSADIWLLRSDFVFEFPRPTMPNVVHIGGFQCKESKPLPAEMEAFMQSSGEHRVIVMSLGSFISALPPDITEAIAAAFAELPQKVIWRFTGEKPSSLGNNTMLVKWLPQNDLLGHPKTRVFVAHGGNNGMYEAIYHGVPVVAMPFMFDQFDNVLRLKARGAARVVEVRSLTKDSFLNALEDVLENPSYRQNVQRLSQLHRDQPVSPMDTAIFWIEYVIRNKGASHLQAAGFSLPWYSCFCLDVAVFFMVITGAFIWGLVLICRFLCCRRLSRKIKTE